MSEKCAKGAIEMNSVNKTKLKKYAVYILLLLSAHLFQNSLPIFPAVFGVRPVFLISAAICMAMYEGEIVGAAIGLFAGALWDTVTVAADGYNALFLMAACAFCGVFLRVFLRNNIVTYLWINSLITFFYFATYVIFFITSRGIDGGLMIFFRYYLPMAVYSVMFTPFWYLIIKKVNRRFPIAYIEY